MKQQGNMNICYNAQIAVTRSTTWIIAADVTNQLNDEQQLARIALAAKEPLGVEPLEVALAHNLRRMLGLLGEYLLEELKTGGMPAPDPPEGCFRGTAPNQARVAPVACSSLSGRPNLAPRPDASPGARV